MENNVVSLETAKKLRAAGFPQKAIYRWYQRQDGTAELQRSNTNPWGEHIYAAPTAQEIANELPIGVRILKQSPSFGHFGYAAYRPPSYGEASIGRKPKKNEQIGFPNDTIADALADLWLKLRETNHE